MPEVSRSNPFQGLYPLVGEHGTWTTKMHKEHGELAVGASAAWGGFWVAEAAAQLFLCTISTMPYSAVSEEPLQGLVLGPQDVCCFKAELAQEVVCSPAVLSKLWPKTTGWSLWKEPPIRSATELKWGSGLKPAFKHIRGWNPVHNVRYQRSLLLGTTWSWLEFTQGSALSGLFQWGPFSYGPFHSRVWPVGCCCSSPSVFNVFLCFDSQKGKTNSYLIHNN